jgi:hypothetical protein
VAHDCRSRHRASVTMAERRGYSSVATAPGRLQTSQGPFDVDAGALEGMGARDEPRRG